MAAPYPEFDGFSMQDSNFVTENIEYRTTPTRSMDSDKLTRRPGIKLLATDFAERVVKMSGYIMADTASELQSYIDSLHRNVTRKSEGALFIESDRYATATVQTVAIADPHYSQTMVPYEIEFLLPDPFFYAAQQAMVLTVVSGEITQNYMVTVSGSVFAEPIITYHAPTTTGVTTTSGIIIQYVPTGEKLTWSGTGGVLTMSYSDSVAFDYANYLISKNATSVDTEGVFSRWEPGETNFIVTFSGSQQGGTLDFVYQPRYL